MRGLAATTIYKTNTLRYNYNNEKHTKYLIIRCDTIKTKLRESDKKFRRHVYKREHWYQIYIQRQSVVSFTCHGGRTRTISSCYVPPPPLPTLSDMLRLFKYISACQYDILSIHSYMYSNNLRYFWHVVMVCKRNSAVWNLWNGIKSLHFTIQSQQQKRERSFKHRNSDHKIYSYNLFLLISLKT